MVQLCCIAVRIDGNQQLVTFYNVQPETKQPHSYCHNYYI